MRCLQWLSPFVAAGSLLLLAAFWIAQSNELEQVEARCDEYLTLRAELERQRRQAYFPTSLRERAQRANDQYLHQVIERLPLRRSELASAEVLAREPALGKLPSVQRLLSQLSSAPPTLHFIAKPAQSGSLFLDRTYQLAAATQVDLADAAQLIELIEGVAQEGLASSTERPLLFITEFKLDRGGRSDRGWRLELQLVERSLRPAQAQRTGGQAHG